MRFLTLPRYSFSWWQLDCIHKVIYISASAQASYGGEDAFFISQQGSTTFGVADGVGGWANSGVNPAGTKAGALLSVVLLSSKTFQSLMHCNLIMLP